MSNVFLRAAEVADRSSSAWFVCLWSVGSDAHDDRGFNEAFFPARFVVGPCGRNERVLALCLAAAMRETGDL